MYHSLNRVFFSKGRKIQVRISKGRLWQYENLNAPFTYSLKKSSEELEEERQSILENKFNYYVLEDTALTWVKEQFRTQLNSDSSSTTLAEEKRVALLVLGEELLDSLYKKGIVDKRLEESNIKLVTNNTSEIINKDRLSSIAEVSNWLNATTFFKKNHYWPFF